MNKSAIQKFAIWARTELIAQVSQKAYQYGITEEGYGGFLGLLKLPDRLFQIQIVLRRDLFAYGCDPPFRITGNRNFFQAGGKGVVDLGKTVIDLSLDQKKLLPSAADLLLLFQQKIMDGVRIPVPEKGGDLFQRHIQSAEVAYGIQTFKLPGAVIAVSCVRIRIFRLQEADSVVVAQDADADVKQPGYLADLK